MKRIAALLMTAVLLFAAMPALADEKLDLSVFRDNPTLYTIDVNTEDDVAFVESALSAKDRSFVHKYESENRYNTTKFDILVVDYLQSDPYPIFRLWISYCSDDSYMNINTASIIFNGKKYTFSGIADKDWYYHDEKGYREDVLIKFGMDNVEFLTDLEKALGDDSDASAMIKAAETMKAKLILHGRENIEAELGEGFFLDFLLIKAGFMRCNGVQYLEKANATEMKVTAE